MAKRSINTVRKSIQTICDQLRSQYYERDEIVFVLAATLLARMHGFVLGPPGTAKSDLIRAFCARIDGANFWQCLYDRQLDKAEVFGPWNLPLYEQTGRWERDTEGTLVDAHIAFGDEIWKAGPSVHNPQLTLLNERIYKNGKTMLPVPLISFFAASNEMPEPELGAMLDRFPVKLQVGYIRDPSNFAAFMSEADIDSGGAVETVTLEDLGLATDYVRAIPMSDAMISTVSTLRARLEGEGVIVSDRTWKLSRRLMRASAFLNGRDAVDDDDLLILRHVLWTVEEQVADVDRAVFSMASPLAKAAMEAISNIAEWTQEIDASRGQSATTRAGLGVELQAKVNELAEEINKLEDEAVRDGRSITRLTDVREAMQELRFKIMTDCMGMTPQQIAESAKNRKS